MDLLLQAIVSTLVFTSSFFGLGAVAPADSVELGLAEMSPAGVSGGFAVPASGCSDTSHGPIHDCDGTPTIYADPPIIRVGDTATVYWDPGGLPNCVLGGNLTSAGPVTTVGSEEVSPTAETTYTITCDGAGNEGAATVKVLPRIQET